MRLPSKGTPLMKRPAHSHARSPLHSFLQAYDQQEAARFHMPGHKGRGQALQQAASYDITEIPGADNLLAPSGLLQRAQEETAHFYGARQTFFCTGGATTALLAAILSLPPQTLLFLPRDAHKSACAALALSGHEVHWFVGPCQAARYDPPDSAALSQLFAQQTQRPRALLLTRPDYYGRCADLAALSRLCDQEDVTLIVDEAHGAHFAFSPALPAHAVPYADMVINSAHKTLDAPNQSAYLHLGQKTHSATPNAERLARCLALLHTSSPSYPHLAALADAWRQQQVPWERHLQRLSDWKQTLPDAWQQALAQGQQGAHVSATDPSRLCFDVSLLGWSPGALAALWMEAGIVMEMYDARRIVGITTPLDDPRWYVRLRAALPPPRPALSGRDTPPPPLPTPALSVREASLRPSESLPLHRAAGRICAQSVGVYPPGSIVIAPGERFDDSVIGYIDEQQQAGATLFGLPPLCVVE